jgi:bla regulator protein blaR1
LKTNGLQPINDNLLVIFNELMMKMGISRKVEIFESNQTFSPIVIGNLKPYILLPISLATNLNIRQLEAILAHELAHIKRYDFLINIIQTFIEILFFFNPSVWWISQQIRQEREHCCDDLSLSITGDKMLLVSALSQIESYRNNNPYSMAFGKKKMPLLNRVKRILGVEIHKNQNTENIIIMTVVTVILGSLFLFRGEDLKAQISNLSIKDNVFASSTNQNFLTGIENKQQQAEVRRDTNVVVENSQESSGNIMLIDGGEGNNYLKSSSRTSSFRIDKNGQIYVDGKKYDASPELLSKIKPYLKKMDLLGFEMDEYGREMDKYGKEMNIYGKKMNEAMDKYGKQMEEQGKLLDMEVKLQTKYSLKASLAQLDGEKTDMEKLRKLEKEQEIKVKAISDEMERLGKEMEKSGAKMGEFSKPMEDAGKKMEIEGEKMEIVGKKMEALSEEIISFLPNELKEKIKQIERERK